MQVVSFLAPRPEHPFHQDFTPLLNVLRASCERFGHTHRVITDDPSLGDDAFVTDLPRDLMRAILAGQLAWLEANRVTPTLFVGADCVLAKDPIAFERDADVVITVGDFADCRMNTGAIYVPRPAAVAHVWRNALANCGDRWGDDQTALLASVDAARAMGLRVAELPADTYNVAPLSVTDPCREGVVIHFRGPRKQWMVPWAAHWLGIGEKFSVKALPNTGMDKIISNVLKNTRRGLPELQMGDAHEGHAVLVGGGPSLAETIAEIRCRREDGQTIFALNGTAAYLREHGIEPDYQVILDPRPENAKFLCGRSIALVASQCDPAVFDAAKGRCVILWHFAQPETVVALEHGAFMIGGGITVGLTAMGLAHAMGFRWLHLFGYDSSDRDDGSHAYEQTEDNAEMKRVTVHCNGKSHVCGVAMYAQAEAFEKWANLLTSEGSQITVHGDGLLPAIAHAMMAARKEMA